MFPFNKPGKKNISPANIHLNLGESPPRNISPLKLPDLRKVNTSPPPLKVRSHSISISPPKLRDTNKPFTSHDIRNSINEFYNIPNPPPKLNLINKLSNLTNNLKKLYLLKNKNLYFLTSVKVLVHTKILEILLVAKNLQKNLQKKLNK